MQKCMIKVCLVKNVLIEVWNVVAGTTYAQKCKEIIQLCFLVIINSF
jgi:hypothetical protein